MGFLKSPKSPSHCLTDIPIQAAGQKDPNWNYEISAYIRIPSIYAPNKKNSTYPSRAGAIDLLLIWNYLFLMIQASRYPIFPMTDANTTSTEVDSPNHSENPYNGCLSLDVRLTDF